MAVLSKVFFSKIDPGHNLHHTISSTLCFSAMAYLFIKEFLSEKKSGRTETILHLLPFLVSVIIALYELIHLYIPIAVPAYVASSVIFVAEHMRLIGLIAYLLLDLYVFKKYRKNFIEQYRSINGSLAIYFFIHKVLLLALIVITSFMMKDMNPFVLFVGLISMPVLVFVAMYYKVFLKLKKVTVELNDKLKEYLSLSSNNDQKEKYAKTRVDETKFEDCSKRITIYLEKEKPYLNLNFSMDVFAEAVNLSNHELSMVLSKMDTGFYQLINKLRVDYFLDHIQEILQDNKSILTLAYESGFNSKSTFNKYFKLTMGISPSEYISSYKKKSSIKPSIHSV